MRPTTLADSKLGISQQEIMDLLDPFVDRSVAEDDPEWRAAIWKRRRKILYKSVGRWLPTQVRSEKNIVREYSQVWRDTTYDRYSLEHPPPKYSPWEWRGQKLLASTFGATRFRQLFLIRFLEMVRPKRVLEVGCGNGINLLLLAGRFPEVEFAGVELTQEGHDAAVALQKLEELPAALQGFAPLELKDPTAFRRIDFHQGSAGELAFEDDAFDLVVTVLSLEQMETIRHQALSEVARVARRHTLMIEPFADVNTSLWPRLNVVRRNYFRGHIDDLPQYGLHPIVVTNDFPQESFIKVCAVLSEKRPAAN